MSKTGRTNKTYSPEFKISVILDMHENHLAYRETVRKYWNTTTKAENSKYVNTVKLWERIFLEEGAEGLMRERRGRGNPLSEKRRGRPPKLDKKVEEDLVAENQRLKMEIEYLKKLDALVQKRIQREGKKQ